MRSAALAAALVVLSLAAGGCLDKVLGGGDPGPLDYITSRTFSTWVIEVDSVQGMAPPAGVLDFLHTRLASVASKSSIDIRVDETLPARGGAWSVHDIEQYSKAHRGTSTGGSTVVLHLLFLDGHSDADSSDGNARVLGSTLTYTNAAGKVSATGPIAIFSQSIKDSCTLLSSSPCTDATPIWRAVLVHEFGHAMGLVNNGVPMVKPHEAATCQGNPDRKHSSNTGSVMNCSVETSNLLGIFGSNIPNDYDADDRADLCHAGGKC